MTCSAAALPTQPQAPGPLGPLGPWARERAGERAGEHFLGGRTLTSRFFFFDYGGTLEWNPGILNPGWFFFGVWAFCFAFFFLGGGALEFTDHPWWSGWVSLFWFGEPRIYEPSLVV